MNTIIPRRGQDLYLTAARDVLSGPSLLSLVLLDPARTTRLHARILDDLCRSTELDRELDLDPPSTFECRSK